MAWPSVARAASPLASLPPARAVLSGEWAPAQLLPGNYLPEACRGCVVVHMTHPLIIGTSPAEDDDDTFLWDPKIKVFAATNTNAFPCFAYLTLGGTSMLDRHGRPFESAATRDEDGHVRQVTTFVLVAPAKTSVALGVVQSGLAASDFYAIDFEELQAIPATMPAADSDGGASPPLAFPLPASHGPYLCTQGVGGHLTHFFPESYHAIDLRCSLFTPVLSAGDGVVKEVAESHRCGGIHAANLASWNAISVHLDCGLIVEYLHTLPGSSKVKTGERVRRGQMLCESGDIGFAPEPHLHVELHEASRPDGPSLPLRFGSPGSVSFVPIAGGWYTTEGEVPPPEPLDRLEGMPRGVPSFSGDSAGRIATAQRLAQRRRPALRFGCASLRRKFGKVAAAKGPAPPAPAVA